jgi:hypothetical protein
MPAGSSVTRWLKQLQEGDPAAAQRLWERFIRNVWQHEVPP